MRDPVLRVLAFDRGSRPPRSAGAKPGCSLETVALRQAAERVSRATGLPFLDADVDLKTELTSPTIVIAAMPEPVRPGEKATDRLLQSNGIRFLLSCPACLVVFVSHLNRAALDDELNAWVRESPHRDLSQAQKYRQLATREPLSWAFVTSDELLAGGDPLMRQFEILKHCAQVALYDPTGLRSYVHLVVSALRFATSPETAPPRSALVVDDEQEPSETFAYLVRRLGFSPVIITTASLWHYLAEEESAPREGSFELALVDNFLGFEGPPEPIGHAWLRVAPMPYKLFKTYRREEGDPLSAFPGECHIPAQHPLDAQGLVELYQKSHGASDGRALWSTLFDPTQQAVAASPGHPHFREAISEIGLTLDETGRRLERDGRSRQAALHHLESYLLLRGRAGQAAADAFGRLHEIEIAELLNNPPRYLQEGWPRHKQEICAGLQQAFQTDSDENRDWSMGKVFQALTRLLRSHGASTSVLQDVESAAREVRAREYKRHKLRVRSAGLKLWKLYYESFNSFKKVGSAWLFMVLVFALIYGQFGIHLTHPDSMPSDVPLYCKAIFASLFGGLGLMNPEAIELGLPHLYHVPIGLFQRILSLLIVARMVALFVTWIKEDV